VSIRFTVKVDVEGDAPTSPQTVERLQALLRDVSEGFQFE